MNGYGTGKATPQKSKAYRRIIIAAVCAAAVFLAFLGYQVWKRQPPLTPHVVRTGQVTEVTPYSVTIQYETNQEMKPRCIWVQRGTRIYDKNWRGIDLSDLEAGQYIRAYVAPAVIYEPYDTYTECYKICVLE